MPSAVSTASSPPSAAHSYRLQAFADGFRQRRRELLAYFDDPTTNGYAEGVTNKIKVIKRRAYGLPTFAGFRDRVLPSMRLTRDHATPPRSTGENPLFERT